jgi:hypothetical protein
MKCGHQARQHVLQAYFVISPGESEKIAGGTVHEVPLLAKPKGQFFFD